MNQQHLYVDKITRTFADNLLAFGLASVVDELLYRQGVTNADVVITDCGSYYELACAPALEIETIWSLSAPLYPAKPIRTPKNAKTLPSDLPSHMVLDYEADREVVNQYYAAREKEGEGELALPPYWEIERAINPLPLPGYNSLVINWWNLHEHQSDALALLLDLYGHTPNDYPAAIETWKELDKSRGWGIKADATCQQLYNPDQGKGQNKSKADGLSIGNVNGFWLAEWLKAVGFYEAALTRTVRGAKDRKTFVVAPRKLSFSASRAVMSDFLKSMSAETSTKFDILAATRYTRALLQHFSDERSPLAQMFSREPIRQHVVAGFDTAFYKDLGNATATMNVSFIALPGWVIVELRDDIVLYIDPDHGLLTHLERLARQFDELHSDAFTLLQHLRDFVSGDDLSAFFRFTNAFAGYYISARHQGKYAYQLTTHFVERLIMNTEKNLTDIVLTSGFKNVAYAIRQSTVTAQYQTQAFKQRGQRYPYDVRYGLAQELLRRARRGEDFVADLGEFLAKYSAETSQVEELMMKRGVKFPFPGQRKSIRTSDLEEIVWLIDQYGSETVANLLIAYGYARVPREDGETEAQANEEENE